MRWEDIATTVGKIAPAAGGALGGPAGAAVGGLIASALGVAAQPEAVAQALHADPQAAVKLRQIEADIERSLIEGRSQVLTAEVGGESWLQRNWRPLVMLWFSILVGAHWLGFTPEGLSEPMVLALFDIVQYGLSGYIVARSAEKISKTVTGSGFMDHLKVRR